MVEKWKQLDRVCRQLADRQPSSNVDKQTDIACRIVATPAKSPRDRAVKRRFIRESNFEEWNSLYELVDVLLKIDAERLAAAR
jgi:hypothetical protein